MSTKLMTPQRSGKEQTLLDNLHALYMQVKVSHYNTKSFAQHKAFDQTFEDLEDLIDNISEQMMGYTGVKPDHLSLGVVKAVSAMDLGGLLIAYGKELCDFACSKNYMNLENLAQEVSGVGARLRYLATLQ